MTGPYDDILHVPHPTSQKHPRMPMSDRAAQISPFAALSGFRESIEETVRQAEERVEHPGNDPADKAESQDDTYETV